MLIRTLLLTASLLPVAACARHTVDVQPIRIEPIYVTVDVNVKVDRDLEEFFDFEDQTVPQTQPAGSIDVSSPAAAPASGVETSQGTNS
jgi:hypothetical protein